MNVRCRGLELRTSIACLVLMATTGSAVASASDSAPTSSSSSVSAEHSVDIDGDYDAPHVRTLCLVLFSAVGYALYRQQRALESLHTLQNAP